MTTWLESYKKGSLRQTTYENYKTLLDAHIISDPIAKIQLQKITTDNLQDFLRRMSESSKNVVVREKVEKNGQKLEIKKIVQSPLAPRVVNMLLFLIKAGLSQSLANAVITRNPASFCKRYKETKREKSPLTTEQQKSFLQSLKEHRLYAAFLLALATGARRGEVLALRWPKVDLDEGSIKIADNLVRVKGGSKFNEPKTDSSRRTILLPFRAVKAFKEHQIQQNVEKLESEANDKKNQSKAPSYQDTGLVFCQTNGTKIDPRNFQRVFETWRNKAGLPKRTRFHDLRHTFVTMLFGAGVDIKTAQSITGHSDTRTLLEIYAHAISESQKKAAEKMNDLLPDV